MHEQYKLLVRSTLELVQCGLLDLGMQLLA
jgi:hypothetical protein